MPPLMRMLSQGIFDRAFPDPKTDWELASRVWAGRAAGARFWPSHGS